MEILKSKLIILAVVIAAVSVTGYLIMQSIEEPGQYDDFAKCLSAEGAKMYGAYWCPYCKDQEEMFAGSWQYVDYVECSLPNRGGQEAVCSEAGVRVYPTWEFKDGQMVEGVLPFEELSQYSGCSL